MCGHATTNAMTYAMMDPSDRTGNLAEVAKTTHVIVDGIRYIANIGGITALIAEVTKAAEFTVTTLPLAVG